MDMWPDDWWKGASRRMSRGRWPGLWLLSGEKNVTVRSLKLKRLPLLSKLLLNVGRTSLPNETGELGGGSSETSIIGRSFTAPKRLVLAKRLILPAHGKPASPQVRCIHTTHKRPKFPTRLILVYYPTVY